MSSRPETPRAPISLWRNRNFMVLWSGELISVLGTGVSRITYPLLVLALTRSPVQAGLVGALRALPYLFLGLPGGALVDRWNRKRVMILCDVGRAVNMATIPAAFSLGHLTAAQLYVNALIGGVLYVLFSTAEATYLPHVVPAEQVPTAAAAEQAMSSATSVVGPPLGGFLFQLGQAIPFLVDALSYAASVMALLFVTAEFQDQREPSTRNLRSEIAEGIRWLWAHPVLRFAYVATGGLSLAVASVALVAIVLAKGEHTSSSVIGLMFSATGVGGLLGSLAAPRLQKRLGFGGVIIAATWAMAILWPLLAVAPNALFLGVALGGMSFAIPIHGIAIVSYRLAATPDELRGRVASVARVIAWSSEPIGVGLSGLLIQVVGAERTALAFGAWVALVAVATTMYGPLRRAVLREQTVQDRSHSTGERVYVCSFCDKTNPEVLWMISGKTGVIICNECVSRCNELIAGADGKSA
ncbi:MAG TPA: MFS transporter [Chloroflexota bacterium]|nr:MFS transporter [Chloroflexota bacterium]